MLSSLRNELESLFKSLTAGQLDRIAYQIWRKNNDEYDEWCKQAWKNLNQHDNFFIQKPRLFSIRAELGDALKSLSIDSCFKSNL